MELVNSNSQDAIIALLLCDLNSLILHAETMAEHFQRLMDGLRQGGPAWNAADMHVRDVSKAINNAQKTLELWGCTTEE